MPVISLTNCNPEPLTSYLRALAVFRLISEQADSDARAWWERDCLNLESRFGKDELLDWFLSEYRPTPIVAPWNGGSGFSPKDRKVGIDAIRDTEDSRFTTYRATIDLAFDIPEVQAGKAAAADEGERRTSVLRSCRNILPDECVAWLDAAISVSSDGSRAFAPILGTGGNEGRLDYTNNFMERLKELLLDPGDSPVRDLLANALFGTVTGGLRPAAVGQYDPGRAGGFNQGQDIETADIPTNPWSFVLNLEGAVAWAAGVYRKQGIACRSFLCSPFTVKASAVGFGSAAEEDDARAEIWVPLWDRPIRYRELKALLREGRASVGNKPARSGLEFAEAASSLGVDRGIAGFVRYSLLKRRGDSYVALPSGRMDVTYKSETDLIRELAPLLEQADRSIQRKPATYLSLRRQVDDATFNFLVRGGRDSLLDVAVAIGRLNRWILSSGREAWMPATLSTAWISKCGDSPEIRIAAALASIYGPAIRDNLAQSNPDFSWIGTDLSARLSATLYRRVMKGGGQENERNPTGGRVRATVADVAEFLDGDLSHDLIENLLFGFNMIDWGASKPEPNRSVFSDEIWPEYALLKYLFWPGPVENPNGIEKYLASDLRVLNLLATGDLEQATELAARRLRIAGFAPLDVKYRRVADTKRLAAALLIPIRRNDLLIAGRTVLRTQPDTVEV